MGKSEAEVLTYTIDLYSSFCANLYKFMQGKASMLRFLSVKNEVMS